MGDVDALEPVLVVLDLDSTAGTALLRDWRRRPLLARLPLIVVTRDEDASVSRREAFEQGAIDYLVKPIDAEEFRLRLGNHVAHAHAAAEQSARARRQLVSLELRLRERMLQLRTSREQLRLALDAAAMCWWQFSPATQEAQFSPNARHILGFVPPRQLLRHLDFIVLEDRIPFAEAFARALTSWQRLDAEFRVIHSSQRVTWHHAQAVIVPGEHGEPARLVGVWRDITERKQGEERSRHYLEDLEARVHERTAELDEINGVLRNEVIERRRIETARQEILRQIVTAQEDERRRISRELHDEIGQHLSALTLGLKSLDRRAADLKTLEQLQALTDRIGREVHEMAFNLRPASLDDLGLLRTVKNLVEEWSVRTGVGVDFHSTGLDDSRLPPHVETTLYRILQEALTNVLKHAQASRVSLILERRADQAIAIVEDDGNGFEAELLPAESDGRRLGLIGMRERAALVAGEMSIESSRGRGTTLFVRIPLPA